MGGGRLEVSFFLSGGGGHAVDALVLVEVGLQVLEVREQTPGGGVRGGGVRNQVAAKGTRVSLGMQMMKRDFARALRKS